MTSSRFVGALCFFSVVIFSGCGGGGGGGNSGGSNPFTNQDGGEGGSGSNSGNHEAFSGVEFTEDTSLDDDITGAWIMTSDIDFTEMQLSVQYEFVGVRRQTFYIIKESGQTFVSTCETDASDIVETDSSLEFDYDNAHYVLVKDSNTRLSGTVAFGTNGGDGQITMIKTRNGPATMSELFSSFNWGSFSYSLNSAPVESFLAVCYADHHGEETYTEGALTETIEVEGFELRDPVDNTVSMERYIGEDYLSFEIAIDGNYFNANRYDEGSTVDYSISGTDVITIDVDAIDAEDAPDTNTLSGTANLSF